MVQVLPAVQRERRRSFGERLSEGVGKAIPIAEQYYNEYKENQALKEKGIDVSDIYDPNTRAQIISQELQQGKKQNTANALIGVNDVEYQRKEMPEFGNGIKKKSIDLNEIIEKKQNQGSIPQTETTGQKVRILDPNELKQLSNQQAKYLTENGVPTTPEQRFAQNVAENQERINHNARVDEDKERVIKAQEKYGNKAVEKLGNVLPNANDEQISLFRKKGEEAAQSGKTESEIDQMMSEEARKYKNTIANVKRSLGPERLGSTQSILGKSRDSEKRKMDLRLKLAPLLDEGQFDTARNLLSELGYHPEEREAIITDLPEAARKAVAEFPKLEPKKAEYPKPMKSGKFEFEYPKASMYQTKPPEYSQEQKQLIYSSVGDVLKNDPSTNLILFRSALDKKGVDWQDFKDALNQNIIEGRVKLNDDQFNHLELLDQPPLDNLDKILYNFNLIGK
jgi:hypothetical protein